MVEGLLDVSMTASGLRSHIYEALGAPLTYQIPDDVDRDGP